MPFNDEVTPGHSTILEYGDGSTYVEVDNVEDVTPGEIDVADIETSHMQSADRWKTYLAGWKEPGEVTATCQYKKAQQVLLLAEVAVHQKWRITLQDGSTIVFDGYLKKLGNPVEREGKVMNSLAIKVSGAPTFAASA